jgi:glucosamine-phosphate N-acetyltransferase
MLESPLYHLKDGDSVLVREMVADDVYRGFLDCLDALSPVGLSPVEALGVFRYRAKAGVRTFVAVPVSRPDLDGTRVVGTASFFVEPKYLHKGGKAAHIEDVAVVRAWQFRGVGSVLVRHVLAACEAEGCYKAVLDCSLELASYYETLGFVQWESQMRKSFRD